MALLLAAAIAAGGVADATAEPNPAAPAKSKVPGPAAKSGTTAKTKAKVETKANTKVNTKAAAKPPAPKTSKTKAATAKPPAAKSAAPKPQASGHIIPMSPKRARQDASGASAFAQAAAGLRGSLNAAKGTFRPLARPAAGPFSVAPATPTSPGDIAAVKRAIEAARKGKDADADAAIRTMSSPVARKLAEWAVLRSDSTKPSFQRYAAFIADNPSWPHIPMFRRRAENALWNDKIDNAQVRAFFAQRQPSTAKGRLMLARALLTQGDRVAAQTLVRETWRNDGLSADVERAALDTFGDMISPADTKWRMNKRFYVDDIGAGMRAAERLGGDNLAIARARGAVVNKSSNAKALLDAVPAQARRDPGYVFSRAQWLRKNDKAEEAAALLRNVAQNPDELVDLDQWWLERQLLVRKLLDAGDTQAAYQIARDSPSPPKDNYRAAQHFLPGWIALRYLNNPATAMTHFARIGEATDNPHALGRAGYWMGRAAEALGQRSEARAFYERGAMHGATYYGQLARAKIGLTDLGLRQLPQFTPEERNVMSQIEIGRAVEILYTLGERDLIAPIYAELGESATDIAGMAMLCEIAEKNRDGRAMLLLGKSAYGRGLPLEICAYPVFGLPGYTPISPPVDDAVVYSIARQESHFNQKVVSSAKAMGFMQVTPVAAKDTSKRFKAPYDVRRLLSDPIYNMQMGAAELSILLSGYRGSYIMTFAGYNAGRGRVRQWIAAYGDPRDPNVDPVDWAERIPIAETRNYVQRILENLQIYRLRFGGANRLLIEADLRRDTGN